MSILDVPRIVTLAIGLIACSGPVADSVAPVDPRGAHESSAERPDHASFTNTVVLGASPRVGDVAGRLFDPNRERAFELRVPWVAADVIACKVTSRLAPPEFGRYRVIWALWSDGTALVSGDPLLGGSPYLLKRCGVNVIADFESRTGAWVGVPGYVDRGAPDSAETVLALRHEGKLLTCSSRHELIEAGGVERVVSESIDPCRAFRSAWEAFSSMEVAIRGGETTRVIESEDGIWVAEW